MNMINLQNPGVLTMILVALNIPKVMAWLSEQCKLKKTSRKAKLSNNDPYLAILSLRTIPQQKHSSSAQSLMNRNLGTTLQSASQLFEQSYNRMQKIYHLWIKDNQFKHIKINPGLIKV